ncbi:hypothetical protein [Streptosporangium sp. G12]
MQVSSGSGASGAPLAHGPADALHPLGDIEVLTHTASGVHVLRQGYADGYIYEYMVPVGVPVDPNQIYFAIPFFQGRYLRTFSEGEFNYITVWVPMEKTEGFDLAFDAAAAMPDFDLTAPEAESELLHQDERAVISRIRLSTGWLYLVDHQLGFPWPSPVNYPCLVPIVNAPIVSVNQTGTSFVSKFWVSDNVTTTAVA